MTAETAGALFAQRRRDHYYGAFTGSAEIVAISMLRGWNEGYEVPSSGSWSTPAGTAAASARG